MNAGAEAPSQCSVGRLLHQGGAGWLLHRVGNGSQRGPGLLDEGGGLLPGVLQGCSDSQRRDRDQSRSLRDEAPSTVDGRDFHLVQYVQGARQARLRGPGRKRGRSSARGRASSVLRVGPHHVGHEGKRCVRVLRMRPPCKRRQRRKWLSAHTMSSCCCCPLVGVHGHVRGTTTMACSVDHTGPESPGQFGHPISLLAPPVAGPDSI